MVSTGFSEHKIPNKVYVMLFFNMLGVIGTVILTVVLILWALGFILHEPDTSPVIKNFIFNFNRQNGTPMKSRADFLDRFWEDEDLVLQKFV